MSGGFRVGFCVSGQGRLFRAAAAHASQIGIVPALVVAETRADPALDKACGDLAIPLVRLGRLRRDRFDQALTASCIQARLDLLCLTFDKLLPAPLVAHYRGRIINVHPGLLPAFPGLDPLPRTIAAGVRFAGATVHEVDEGIDTGAILAQAVIGTRPDDSPQSLGARLYGLLRPMFLQTIAWYASGRVYRDGSGRLLVRGALYGDGPISPAVELSFSG